MAQGIIMRIIGIDPGYAILGYGVVEMKVNKLHLIGYGAVRTDSGMDMPNRLKCLYTGLMDVINEYDPQTAAVEELFFNTNAKTALLVGQARGAALLACINSGLSVYEYTPLQIKQGLTGYGKADKRQMQMMVKTLLRLKDIPKPDDAADALAAAICHAHSADSIGRLENAAVHAGGT